MKRAKKQCLGFFGLSLVAAMTIVAANVPSPEASAVTTAMVDTITVRAIGPMPDVNIHGIDSSNVYTQPVGGFSVDYENIETMNVSVEYTDLDQNTSTTVVDDARLDYVAGTKNYEIPQLKTNPQAYGKYIIKVSGIGRDGVYDEDDILFYYLPFSAKMSTDDLTGKKYVDLEYIPSDGTSKDTVAKIIIDVYDKDGNSVGALSPITVKAPVKKVEIPFAEKDSPSGRYNLKITAYNSDGDQIYTPRWLETEYKAEVVPDAGTPDTGGLFQNLNISEESYLVSGFVIFFALGIAAFWIVARNKKSDTKRTRH